MSIELNLLNDGTLEVRTTDADPYLAEARAKELAVFLEAIAECRRRGEPRPVLLRFLDDPMPGAERWGVMTRAEARAALQQPFGKQARRLFRTARWPEGYYTVHVFGEAIEVCESRTWEEVARDRAA